MADPARYTIDAILMDAKPNSTSDKVSISADLFVERDDYGKWVKWTDFVDYKEGIKRNNTEGAVTKLGLEIVELRTRLQEMEKAGNRLARAVKRLKRADYDGDEGVDKLLKDWEDSLHA